MTKAAFKLPVVNPSGIDPVEYKVVVLPVEEKGYVELKGGFRLHKPDETKERDKHAAMEGDIIAVSPLAFCYEEWPKDAQKPRVGDRVVFARYAGVTLTGSDNKEYRIMNDKDVVAVRR